MQCLYELYECLNKLNAVDLGKEKGKGERIKRGRRKGMEEARQAPREGHATLRNFHALHINPPRWPPQRHEVLPVCVRGATFTQRP